MVCLFTSMKFKVYSRWGLVQSWPVRTEQWVRHIFWKTWCHAHCHRVPDSANHPCCLNRRTPQNANSWVTELRKIAANWIAFEELKRARLHLRTPAWRIFWNFQISSQWAPKGCCGVQVCSVPDCLYHLISTLNWKPVVHWGLGLASSCRATHFTIDKQHSGLRVVFLNRFC